MSLAKSATDGVVLMGDAAQSYVQLQWVKFYVNLVMVPLILFGMGFLLWIFLKPIWKEMKKDFNG